MANPKPNGTNGHAHKAVKKRYTKQRLTCEMPAVDDHSDAVEEASKQLIEALESLTIEEALELILSEEIEERAEKAQEVIKRFHESATNTKR